MKSTLIVLKEQARWYKDGWMGGKKKDEHPSVTSSEQAASTVGGSQGNGIIHVLLAHSVYLSTSLAPSLSPSTEMYGSNFAFKTLVKKKKRCCIISINMKDNLKALVKHDRKLDRPCEDVTVCWSEFHICKLQNRTLKASTRTRLHAQAGAVVLTCHI